MTDDTAEVRRGLIERGRPQHDLAAAETAGRQRWTTKQMQEEFEVRSFMAPFVAVRRKSDGQLGSLEFTHSPRVYFNFEPHSPV